MNFVPGNGTHTPRWNPEHMMSTELRFTSRIYNTADPEIPVMNPRPKQRPNQYVAAHPTWSGAEEARQMKRVESFTRRFAYLLEAEPTRDDTDPKIRSNRLFGSPRELLTLMANHYTEHTEHVKAKMTLSQLARTLAGRRELNSGGLLGWGRNPPPDFLRGAGG